MSVLQVDEEALVCGTACLACIANSDRLVDEGLPLGVEEVVEGGAGHAVGEGLRVEPEALHEGFGVLHQLNTLPVEISGGKRAIAIVRCEEVLFVPRACSSRSRMSMGGASSTS